MKARQRIATYFNDTEKPLVVVHAICGCFAVHLVLEKHGNSYRNKSRHWTVTHIRSGLRCTGSSDQSFDTKEKAIAYARTLDSFGNWDTDNPKTDCLELIANVNQWRAVQQRLLGDSTDETH